MPTRPGPGIFDVHIMQNIYVISKAGMARFASQHDDGTDSLENGKLLLICGSRIPT